MSFFKEIEGEGVILVERGVFKQVPLATRDGYLFAKSSGGYVRLMADGATSKANVRIDFLTYDGALYRDPFGKLCTGDVAKAKALAEPEAQKLLGAS